MYPITQIGDPMKKQNAESCQDITKQCRTSIQMQVHHRIKLLPALQQGHADRLFLCFLEDLGDLGHLGGREDQQVQLGLDHPD